jgi:hypothetical protein
MTKNMAEKEENEENKKRSRWNEDLQSTTIL